MPFFSIGLTTYDRKEMLIETLSSITSQTFPDFEVIVANDNPARTVTGESLGISDPRIHFVNNPENLGEFDNANSLLQLSRSRYFTWLADDDLYAPDFLQSVYDALTKYDYPTCVFTSFQDIRDGLIPSPEEIRPEDITVFDGREFLRRYLARELMAIGSMGFFDAEYLRQGGGLEDVSADGNGLYCEYMLIIRAGLLDRIAYVDVPLIYFRVHQANRLLSNTSVQQYQRAGINLVSRSIECFRQPQLLADFDSNLVNLLKWFMSDLVTASRRLSPFRLPQFVSFLFFARHYIGSLKGSKLYPRALWCLFKADVWLAWTLLRQAFFATAPPKLIELSYFVRSFSGRDKISTS